ncbi:MAG: tripartite tricarboxylate transporter substrate binding protein [Desulfobacterales bacterium]|nr:tripartite tricarboxylate transporter substrate binding protein [Desulfobacterales bacterium]
MQRKILSSVLAIMFCVGAMIITLDAKAEYPDQPIEFVVHSSPGGGSDLFSRTVAHMLETQGLVKQKINVNNRTGGSGTVAMNYMKSKAGSAYVLMQFTSSPLSTMIRGTSKMKLEEITFLPMMTMDVNMAWTRSESKFNDMKEVIAYAKKHPNGVSVAYGSTAGSEHICAHRISKAAGVKLNMVGFGGGGPAAVAMLGGHVDFSFGNLEEQMGQLEAGKVKSLGTMTPERLSQMPDLPTMLEQGINATFIQPRGFWAPPNMPDYAVKFWEDALLKLYKSKGFQDFLKKSYMEGAYMTSADTKVYITKFLKELKVDVDELGAFKKKK